MIIIVVTVARIAVSDRLCLMVMILTLTIATALPIPIIITMRVKADDHEGAIKKAKSLRHPDFRVDSCGRVWDN